MKATKEKNNYLDLSITDIALYRDDEVFAPIVDENNRWISNYGRIIGWSENKGYELKHVCHGNTKNNPYYHIYSNTIVTKAGKRKKLYIHRLVAGVFCRNDNPELRSEVHHIVKFNAEVSNEENNRHNNLVWVSRKLHTTLDAIKGIMLVHKTSPATKVKEFSNPYDAFEVLKVSDDEFIRFIEETEPILQHQKQTIYRFNEFDIEIGTYESLNRVVGSYDSKNYNKIIRYANNRLIYINGRMHLVADDYIETESKLE